MIIMVSTTIYSSEEEERLELYDFVGKRSVHIFLANDIHLELFEDKILVYSVFLTQYVFINDGTSQWIYFYSLRIKT